MKDALIRIAKARQGSDEPVYCVRFKGRRTGVVVGRKDGATTPTQAVAVARQKKKNGPDQVAACWRLRGESLARARRGEWIKDYGPDGKPAPDSVRGYGPPKKS